MSDNSPIGWTNLTWNLVTGCTKVSPGCKFCYVERDWARLAANPKTRYYGRDFTDVQCHPELLDIPLRLTRPRRIFVNAMSDLFHEDVPDAFLDRVFAVMALSPRHTFQILTKRADRMRRYMDSCGGRVLDNVERFEHYNPGIVVKGQHDRATAIRNGSGWPLPNVHLGVSIEDPAAARSRIPELLRTLAAVRWFSMEPLLEAVDLCHIELSGGPFDALRGGEVRVSTHVEAWPAVDWVVPGGESGSKARSMVIEFAEDIVRQCLAAGVPVFMKQLGAKPINRAGEPYPISDRAGKIMEEWPEVLRVQEYPQ